MNAYFLGTAIACAVLAVAVFVATRRVLRQAGRDITYVPNPAAQAPAGHRSRHRRTITYVNRRPARVVMDFADIAAANRDADLDFDAYADLYLVPEETTR